MKVIGVSAHNGESYVKAMIDSGASGYVTKSAIAHELVRAIHAVHEGKSYICEELKTKCGQEAGGEIRVIPIVLQGKLQFTSSFSCLKLSLGFNPSNSNIARSSSQSGLGVVSSFSPAKIELAPAMKQRACSARLISVLPALSLTMV